MAHWKFLSRVLCTGWLLASLCGPAMAEERFEPNWESLKKYSVPAWFEDAKFGIFVHWGVYSVPAFDNEW